MPIKQIIPQEAHDILEKDKNALYVDVRSIPEFTAGHAAGAINIPILHKQSGQMAPNPDFLRVAQTVLPKDKTLVVGCQMGGRSQRACEVLEGLGYTKLHNIQGGFGGAPTVPGWRDSGLPTSTDNGEGVSFDSLLKKAT